MKLGKAVTVMASLALIGASGVLAAGPPTNPGNSDHAKNNPGQPAAVAGNNVVPPATTPVQGKAYGLKCQAESKKHVAGQKGTPFSRCVTAMAKLASGSTNDPKAACATLSKKHDAGHKGTPFSRCVSAAAKLNKELHRTS
jgi:hypothetical protein